jgi:small multidrug resistance family-3 protein
VHVAACDIAGIDRQSIRFGHWFSFQILINAARSSGGKFARSGGTIVRLCMSRNTGLLFLLLAAACKAGGDVIIRTVLRSFHPFSRFILFLIGAGALFAYGWIVNAPAWNFVQLLGIYGVLFFVLAQIISWVAFGQPPSRAVLVGGALIVSGGMIITFGKH